MPLAPILSASLFFTGSKPALATQQKAEAQPSAISLFKPDIYAPLLQKQGVALLEDAIQKYIQAQDTSSQGKAYSWIHQLLARGVRFNQTRQDNFHIVDPVLQAKMPQLLKLLKEYGADIPSAQAIKKAYLVLQHAVTEKTPDCPERTKRVQDALLTPGLPLNRPPFYKTTLLGYAARHGHIELVNLLVQAGADVNLPNEGSVVTPLSEAAGAGYTAIVKALLAAQPDINIADQYRRTPLSWAVIKGHAEIVKLLLNQGADITVADQYHHTPLWYAEMGGHPEIAALFKQANQPKCR